MFQNREEAGRLLAEKLREAGVARGERGIVLAIPRGGVVVGKVIAQELSWPLSVVVVKKIGAPENLELAIGAVAEGGVKVIDWELALRLGVEQEWLEKEVQNLRFKIQSSIKKFRGGRKLRLEKWKLKVIVDDGVATGATVEAAIKATQASLPKAQGSRFKIILAVPVAAAETVEKLRGMVDELLVLQQPVYFSAVGQFYREFGEVSDAEVVELLKSEKNRQHSKKL